MKRLAFVVHRYGKEINGGAEDHCRLLAHIMKSYYSIDVLTTCSLKQWDNHYPSGVHNENGISVLRFSVVGYSAGHDLFEHIELYCPDLVDFIKDKAKQYEGVIFIGYSFGRVGLEIVEDLNNGILLPTAHNEAGFKSGIYYKVFGNSRGILYNSVEEKKLVESYYNVERTPSRITCFGINTDSYHAQQNQNTFRYIMYAGRVSTTKNFGILNDYFIRYKKNHDSDLKLVVIGNIDDYMTIVHHEDIVLTGFISEEEKVNYLSYAQCLVCPSYIESLCIVLLESFACKRPVLVNGECDVLRGQCERSNGGLYYTSYEEFEAEMDYILNNPDIADEMGRNGYRYVKEEYNYDIVRDNVNSLINEINEKEVTRPIHRIEDYIPDRSHFDVRDIVKEIQNSIESSIKENSGYEKYCYSLIRKLSIQKEIVIVGAGKKGNEAKGFLESNGIRSIVCIADNGDNDYDSISLACKKYPDAVFIITPRYYMTELMREIMSNSISPEQIELYMR